MREGGKHYEWIKNDKERGSLIEYYVDNNQIEEAYKVANKYGNQMARELTLYLLKEHSSVFQVKPLNDLDYVPENYLYEAVAEDLFVYIPETTKEIRDWAFAFCKIKKLLISNKVKRIGDGALSLNAGEIVYEGTKEEFIANFLGKTKCFERTNRQQKIICSNGELVINK